MKFIYDEICRTFIDDINIKAAIIIGSQARENAKADEYSDLDVIVFCENHESYLHSEDYLKNTTKTNYISFIENTLFDSKERRILFEDGSDVDLIFVDISKVAAFKNSSQLFYIFNKGYKIVKDEIGISEILKELQNKSVINHAEDIIKLLL